MIQAQTIELINTESLPARVSALHAQGCRLVQIGATPVSDQFEVNYTFEQQEHLLTLRVPVPLVGARVPSISPTYWCAALYENELYDLFKIQVEGLAVDFQGKFYRTAIPFAFGTTKAPKAKPTPPPPPQSTLAPAAAS